METASEFHDAIDGAETPRDQDEWAFKSRVFVRVRSQAVMYGGTACTFDDTAGWRWLWLPVRITTPPAPGAKT